jgi:hypothetical protein
MNPMNNQDQSAGTLTDRPRDTQGCSSPSTGSALLSESEREQLDALFNAGAARMPAADEHWIHGYDESLSYCYKCANKELATLLEKEPNADYSVDGGWRMESDSTPFCESCAKLLDACLTSYGCEAELDHFTTYGFDPKSDDDCRAMSEVINSMGWEAHDFPHEEEHKKRSRAERFAQLYALCRAILDQLALQNNEAQPRAKRVGL